MLLPVRIIDNKNVANIVVKACIRKPIGGVTIAIVGAKYARVNANVIKYIDRTIMAS